MPGFASPYALCRGPRLPERPLCLAWGPAPAASAPWLCPGLRMLRCHFVSAVRNLTGTARVLSVEDANYWDQYFRVLLGDNLEQIFSSSADGSPQAGCASESGVLVWPVFVQELRARGSLPALLLSQLLHFCGSASRPFCPHSGAPTRVLRLLQTACAFPRRRRELSDAGSRPCPCWRRGPCGK